MDDTPTTTSAPDAPKLAWLYRLFAALKALFARDLPELDLLGDAEARVTPNRYTLLAWGWDPESETAYPRGKAIGPPDEVDYMIADLGTRCPGAALTLVDPTGKGVRLNRHARRAAFARVRRHFRREARKAIGQRKMERIRAREGARP